jgi:hypothetical protein
VRQAVGTDGKAKLSNGLLLAGILCALAIDPRGQTGVGIAMACYIGVAVVWFVPDRRIDRLVHEQEAPG